MNVSMSQHLSSHAMASLVARDHLRWRQSDVCATVVSQSPGGASGARNDLRAVCPWGPWTAS